VRGKGTQNVMPGMIQEKELSREGCEEKQKGGTLPSPTSRSSREIIPAEFPEKELVTRGLAAILRGS
jgi:hypothetical protein